MLLAAVNIRLSRTPRNPGTLDGDLEGVDPVNILENSYIASVNPVLIRDNLRRDEIVLLDMAIDGLVSQDNVEGQIERTRILAADHLSYVA